MRSATNLHDRVVEDLGQRIAAGELAEGSVVSIDQLERRLSVSRSVIREALRVLGAKGLVVSRRRVGVTVLPQSEWHVLDPAIIRWRLASPHKVDVLRSLGELRQGVEPTAAALASQRASADQCRALSAAVVDMTVHARSGDLEAYLIADRTFHNTLLEASGNEMLAALRDVVGELLAGRTHHGLMPAQPKKEAIELHGKVATAVLGRNASDAESAMRAIVDEATEAMTAIAATR